MRLFFAFFLFSFLFFSGCFQSQELSSEAEKVGFVLKYPSVYGVVEQTLYADSGSSLVLAFAENNVPVKYRDFSFGKMVVGIGDLEPSGNEYLAIYANGSYADRGVSDILVYDGLVVEFKVEKIV